MFTIDALMTPITRGLTTLEGQNTTCSDVFSIYVGIAIGFNRVFQKPGVFPFKVLSADSN